MLHYDPYAYPFPSKRQTVYARRGIVATSHPMASYAGFTMLERGGNAIDAAVASAAMLTVVEPGANGIGGDNFAILWHKGKMYGMNSSGFAPAALSAETLRKLGHTKMPLHGWGAVTVPGTPYGWQALIERFGNLTLAEVLAPAIEAAEEGVAMTAYESNKWRAIPELYKDIGELAAGINHLYTRDGDFYRPGEIFRSPGHARTLRILAEQGARGFYEGEPAQAIVDLAQKTGGYLTMEDFAAYHPDWVEPIHQNYRGYDVWELPPNGQGIVCLMALGILKGFEFRPDAFGTPETVHLQLEAMKLAFADAMKYVSDPSTMSVTVESLLSDAYAEERRRQIRMDEAQLFTAGKPDQGGTVYLAAADGDTMISFIQSNYQGFGSGIVIPEYGLSLHNRGNGFTLEEGHDNMLRPRKRCYHTIIPGFLTKDGQPVGPFGVMGAFMQPQGHLQVLMNTIDFHMNPQAALDAPRWCWNEGKSISIERGYGWPIYDALQAKGHEMSIGGERMFGRGQVIWRTDYGTLAGGTEMRTDGTIMAR